MKGKVNLFFLMIKVNYAKYIYGMYLWIVLEGYYIAISLPGCIAQYTSKEMVIYSLNSMRYVIHSGILNNGNCLLLLL